MIPGFAEALDAAREYLRQIIIENLPSLPIDKEGWEDKLPRLSVIYFVRSQSKGLLYIGRAKDLSARWRSISYPTNDGYIYWVKRHKCAGASLRVGDCVLHWLEMPKEHQDVAEPMLIRMYDPPWNGHGSDKKDAVAGDPYEPDTTRPPRVLDIWKDRPRAKKKPRV